MSKKMTMGSGALLCLAVLLLPGRVNGQAEAAVQYEVAMAQVYELHPAVAVAIPIAACWLAAWYGIRRFAGG